MKDEMPNRKSAGGARAARGVFWATARTATFGRAGMAADDLVAVTVFGAFSFADTRGGIVRKLRAVFFPFPCWIFATAGDSKQG